VKCVGAARCLAGSCASYIVIEVDLGARSLGLSGDPNLEDSDGSNVLQLKSRV